MDMYTNYNKGYFENGVVQKYLVFDSRYEHLLEGYLLLEEIYESNDAFINMMKELDYQNGVVHIVNDNIFIVLPKKQDDKNKIVLNNYKIDLLQLSSLIEKGVILEVHKDMFAEVNIQEYLKQQYQYHGDNLFTDLHSSKDELLNLVDYELEKAIEKHGYQENATLFEQWGYTTEEDGETIKDIIDNNLETAIVENAQAIAMRIKLNWLMKRALKK